MNKSAFLELIQQAANISDQQTEELEKMAATFPYCQTAHLLLAKSAYDKGSMLSTQRLRRASAYATNRQLLKRIIYTSPAPTPVFDEPATEQQTATAAPEATNAITESATALHQEYGTLTPVADEGETTATFIEAAPEDEEVTEQAALVYEEAPVEDKLYTDEVAAEAEVEKAPLEASHTAGTPDEEIQEANAAAEELIPYELAQLLTINSLNATFTDLLAQKPDAEANSSAELKEEQQSHVTFPDDFKEADDELAQIIAEESPVSAQGVYVLDENYSSSAVVEDILPEPEDAGTALATEKETEAAPEDAPVNYAFSEIDRMYAEDTIGYWMSSSRMGEVLQLKDEVTRQRPEGFHPELILEYSKTHVLEEKPEEPKAPSLHHQLNIIDQFLKLNPRLKTMNNIKMKQEPQEDLSLRNSKIKKGIASESLANIFLKQGKVNKAIKIYEQLILKYPEKKSYFAEQIEKLQKLD